MTAPPLCAAPPRAAVAVVVLTWNGREDTLRLLATLAPQLAERDHLLVADNGSTDGTEAAVRARHPEVRYLQNGANLGFAGGNNTALRAALALEVEWVFVLNNDTVLAPGQLDALLAAADAARADEPRLGAVQPALVRADDPATIDSCGQQLSYLPGAADLLAGHPTANLPAEPTPIFGACGAAALVHREALAATGGFDEDLFVLFEDTDLACRLRSLGFTALLLPAIRIRHARGVSARRSAVARARRTFWVQRNLVTLALRWWPAGALALASPVLLLRALHALALGAWLRTGPCLGLWWRALRARRGCRRGLRAHGADAWFGEGLMS